MCEALFSWTSVYLRVKYTFEPHPVPTGSPIELHSLSLDSRTLLLSWSPPLVEDRNGVTRMYIVNLTEEETGRKFHFETELITLNLTSMHPFYHYSWSVAAYTVGIGPYSNPLTVQMPEDSTFLFPMQNSYFKTVFPLSVPSGSPNILTALRTGPTVMEVVYAHVPLQESNGVITAYCITYYVNERATGCQNPVTVAVPANATLAIIQGVDPTQEYCVTVAARTSVGLGESSQVVTVGCKCCFVTCVHNYVNKSHTTYFYSVLLCYYPSSVATRTTLHLVIGELIICVTQ